MQIPVYGFNFASFSRDEEREERVAKNRLNNARMAGGFISRKNLKHMENAAGIFNGGGTDPIKTKTKINRNDICPCGSKKKYKHCCR